MVDGSPLSGILEKVREKREAVYKDIRVDGLSDRIGHDVFVRYAAKVPAELLSKRLSRLGGDAPIITAYLNVLVDLCHGVYAVVEGKSYGMSEEAPTDPDSWPRFDETLRAVLPDGVEPRATSIARALFEAGYAAENVTQAHAEAIRHGQAVMRWIGMAAPLAGEDGLGD